MTKRSITVRLEDGLDARPVALLVQEASKYESNIYIEVDDKRINAKSIMGMMSLGLCAGEELTVCLLYTSPSPRDKRQSRMPSSA